MTPQGRKPEPGSSFYRTRCGLILADASLKPLYLNSEVIPILEANPKSVAGSIQARLREISAGRGPRENYLAEVTSGQRRYFCRVYPVDTPPQLISKSQQQPAVLFLFERSHISQADLEFIANTFHLTAREQCTLAFLTRGLPDKEIATRMKVSPNTVKAFSRNLMAKMGVSTRMELMRKLLDYSYFAPSTKAGASSVPLGLVHLRSQTARTRKDDAPRVVDGKFFRLFPQKKPAPSR
jgi:DNA-binding CsgD family transcriptional regulator